MCVCVYMMPACPEDQQSGTFPSYRALFAALVIPSNSSLWSLIVRMRSSRSLAVRRKWSVIGSPCVTSKPPLSFPKMPHLATANALGELMHPSTKGNASLSLMYLPGLNSHAASQFPVTPGSRKKRNSLAGKCDATTKAANQGGLRRQICDLQLLVRGECASSGSGLSP